MKPYEWWQETRDKHFDYLLLLLFWHNTFSVLKSYERKKHVCKRSAKHFFHFKVRRHNYENRIHGGGTLLSMSTKKSATACRQIKSNMISQKRHERSNCRVYLLLQPQTSISNSWQQVTESTPNTFLVVRDDISSTRLARALPQWYHNRSCLRRWSRCTQ